MNDLKVLKAQIISELDNLKKLLDEAADIVNKNGYNINITAGGSVLHDFYKGDSN